MWDGNKTVLFLDLKVQKNFKDFPFLNVKYCLETIMDSNLIMYAVITFQELFRILTFKISLKRNEDL